jgi:hypothetical protein
MRFKLPVGSTAFTLEFSGGNVTQDISEALPTPLDAPLITESEQWKDVVDFV